MNDNLDNLYDQKYYKSHEFGFRAETRSDHKLFLELLQVKPTDRVLEIGCGLGILLSKVPSENKIGIESNDTAVGECKKKGLNIIKADAEKGLPFEDGSFDIVIMNEVIEHLKDPGLVLEECHRVLAPKGRIVVTTPVRSFFVRDLSETHFSEMNTKEIKDLMDKTGFNIIDHRVSGISFLYPFMELFVFKPFRILRYSRKDKEKTVNMIDSCNRLAGKTILIPLNRYRKSLFSIGCNQLIFSQKKD